MSTRVSAILGTIISLGVITRVSVAASAKIGARMITGVIEIISIGSARFSAGASMVKSIDWRGGEGFSHTLLPGLPLCLTSTGDLSFLVLSHRSGGGVRYRGSDALIQDC